MTFGWLVLDSISFLLFLSLLLLSDTLEAFEIDNALSVEAFCGEDEVVEEFTEEEPGVDLPS